MELCKQIKKYRNDLGLSQDALAEKVFVSRQTISNWENDKSYPDVNSLLLLSEVFGVSIDILIKGDVMEMKKQILTEDREKFEKLSKIFAILLIATIISPIPLMYFLHYVGIAIWIVLFGIGMYFALQVEKMKKQFDIQTYREIVAFMEERDMDEISKAKEEGKRPYQKVLLACAAGLITFIVAVLLEFFFKIW